MSTYTIDKRPKKRQGRKAETSGGESPSLVSLGWVWSRDKPGEANALERCEAPSNSPEEAIEEAKESQISPVYVFELFVGPVRKYTNQLVEETL